MMQSIHRVFVQYESRYRLLEIVVSDAYLQLANEVTEAFYLVRKYSV